LFVARIDAGNVNLGNQRNRPGNFGSLALRA
jgi:hypothetical protein